MTTHRDQKVAIAGLGAIGLTLAQRLNEVPGLALAAVSARDRQGAEQRLAAAGIRNIPILAAEKLAEQADIVVECLPAAHFEIVARPALAAGRTLVVLSAAALLSSGLDTEQNSPGRIVVCSGAILGLDGVRAAAEGTIHDMRIITTKPPRGLTGAPYLTDRKIDPAAISELTRIFAGPVREGAKGFPANVNVAAALSLAGIGPDRTQMEVWADPQSTRNRHRIEVKSDAVNFSIEIEGVPSPSNPATGLLTAQSALTTLRRLATPPVIVGS